MLIAEPFMRDDGFGRSVVLLCDYSQEEGSIGYVLNKPMNLQMQEVINNFPEFESKVYYGGPVASDTLHFIHMKGDIIEGSVEIKDGVYWGGNFEKIKFLIKTKVLKPDEISFYLGYTGWSAGQLEDELSYGSWIQAELDRNYLFKKSTKNLWKQILNNKGKHFTVISKMPDGIYQN